MEDNQRVSMENAGRIIRKSVYTWLQNYQYFTTTSALLALPFSVSILLSQALVLSSSSLVPTMYYRLKALSQAVGFPASSEFFTIFNLQLSKTVSSSIFTLPFALTFFLIAKASVIQALNHQKPTSQPYFSCIFSIFILLLVTYTRTSLVIISANATAFCVLFVSFNFLRWLSFPSPVSFLLFSAVGAVLYSVILANALIICNLALVLSGMEKSSGFLAILKACIMIQGRVSMALSLAVPTNLALAGIEALFQYRIVTGFLIGETSMSWLVLEGMLIAYLYSIFIVLDTIVSCNFFKTCKASLCIDRERISNYRIEIAEQAKGDYVSLKVTQEQ